jgi:chorismate dehydratase
VQEVLPPRLGCVQYLNARPLARGWPGTIEFDHPARLCRRLAAGELDVALVSSFEFLRNPIYSIVDDVAIASNGPVYSVFVAHERGRDLREIEIDPASATGVSLMRCLLGERNQVVTEFPLPDDKLSELGGLRARLLIGDQAIRFRQEHGERYEYWDLGEA